MVHFSRQLDKNAKQTNILDYILYSLTHVMQTA